MSERYQLKHGTEAATAAYVGPPGEITVSEGSFLPLLHDGRTPGGHSVDGVVYGVTAPSIIAPAAGADEVSSQPILQSSTFTGDGNHIAAYWEVATDSGFTDIIHASGRTTSGLVSYDLGDAGVNLEASTTYYVRARHESDLSVVSNWGAVSHFTTDNGIVAGLELRKFVGSDDIAPAAGAEFGTGLAITHDNNMVVIGAPGYSTQAGQISIYRKLSGNWILTQQLSPAPAGSFFGNTIKISRDGNIMAVGAHSHDLHGSVWLYQWNPTNNVWDQLAVLSPPASTSNQFFGFAFDLSDNGTVIAIGAYGDNTQGSYMGAVHLYSRTGATLTPLTVKYPPTLATGWSFGCSVALSGNGNTLAVGSYLNSSTNGNGSVFILDRSGNDWTQRVQLAHAPDDGGSTEFGINLAMDLSGTTLAVSAPQAGNGNGRGRSISVYILSNNAWVLQQVIKPNDNGNINSFGAGVALSDDGDVLLAGHPGAYNGGYGTGATYLFLRDTGAWTQETKIIPTTYAGGGYFGGRGTTLSGDGTLALVDRHLSNEGGSGSNTGSAFLFS